MDYRIERLSAQNIHHLESLYRVVFGQVVSRSFLLKKYDTKAFGADYVGFIAISQVGMAVAYYGVIPCYFRFNGETVVAAQSADTMTHPDFRKKGLFQMLAKKTYDLAFDLNIRFIFGFPNQDSYPGFVRLGWKFLPDHLQVFTMKISGLAYARILRKSPLLFNLYNGILRRILPEDRPKSSFFEDKASNGVNHDGRFCNYKTYYTTHIVTIDSASAWLRADGQLKVGAVKGLNKTNATNFLNGIKSLASKLGSSDVVFMTSKYSALYGILSETLTGRDAFPIGFLPLQEEFLSLNDVAFEYCDVDIF